jgi:hypothetical protein
MTTHQWKKKPQTIGQPVTWYSPLPLKFVYYEVFFDALRQKIPRIIDLSLPQARFRHLVHPYRNEVKRR